jgi:hypothetical protein
VLYVIITIINYVDVSRKCIAIRLIRELPKLETSLPWIQNLVIKLRFESIE